MHPTTNRPQRDASFTEPDKAILLTKTTSDKTITPATSKGHLPEIISDNSHGRCEARERHKSPLSNHELSKFFADGYESLTDLESLEIIENVPIAKPGESNVIPDVVTPGEVAQAPGMNVNYPGVSTLMPGSLDNVKRTSNGSNDRAHCSEIC